MPDGKEFDASEWSKILALLNASGEDFGLPEHRDDSVVIATFNIRKLGTAKNRPRQAWDFLCRVCARFDLLAIQEVLDNLEGLNKLKDLLGEDYGMVASDTTGTFPGDRGLSERLAFLFNWKRVERGEVASDISYDRSKVVQTLFDHHLEYQQSWEEQIHDLGAWEEKVKQVEKQNQELEDDEKRKRKPGKPKVELPTFLTFIRQPHCVAFRVPGAHHPRPYEFLVINAHLLYGKNEQERRWEFDSLIEWLSVRAKKADRLYYKNMLLLGDCNLEFEDTGIIREEIDAQLKALNKTKLKSKKAAQANFPLLSEHPQHGALKTSLRNKQTYDQIAIFAHDERLPRPEDNAQAGQQGADGYDYGVFNISELIAHALFAKSYRDLDYTQRKHIIDCAQHDLSDHMPAWIRLPIPE